MSLFRYTTLLVLAASLSSCFFIGPSHLRRLERARQDGPIDIAIVPGFPFKNGQWDTLLKSRILWSLYLYKKGIVKNLVFSGAAVYTPYTEGKIMALYAAALGIDPAHIFIDTLAEHSTENLYYGYKIARQHGFNTIAVATDPFQCSMLYTFSKKHFNTTFYFLPIIYDSIKNYNALSPNIDITQAFVQNFIPLPDRVNYADRFKGTRGKGIKYDTL